MSKRSASLLISLANGLSLIRLFAVPVIVFLIWRSSENESSRYVAFWLIVGLHAGDMLDGFLARKGSRRLAVRNHFGEIIDPIADKMYIGAAFVTMALTEQFLGWFAVLVVLRDSSIIAGWSLIYKRTGVRLLPNLPGKLTDGFSAALLGVVLLGLHPALIDAVTHVTAGLILFSGYSYARMAMRALAPTSIRRMPSSVDAAQRGPRRAARDGVGSPS